MSSRWDVDLRLRSRSACSNRRIRSRTDMAAGSARRAAPALEETSEGGRQVHRVDVPRAELVDQHLHALGGRQTPVEEDHVLAAHAAAAAPHAVADLAQQRLLADLDVEAARHLLQ